MTLRTEVGRELEAALNEKIKYWADHVVAGRAATHEDYRKHCGMIAGLNEALALANEAERKVLRLDEKEH